MRNTLFTAALIVGGALSFQPAAFAHGGTYRGPGDTVPPGGSGGGGGGNPATPGTGSPAAPSGPNAGTPAPGTPGSGGGGPGAGGAPQTGGGDAGPDLTDWSFWWEFNKDPYINLKDAISKGETTTGSGDWFLGSGEADQAKDSMAPSAADIQNKIVPALLDALKTETNNDIVTGCMMALAKIGEEAKEDGTSLFAGEIQKFLKDGNQEISETAAVALGILANPASLPILTDLYKDTSAGRQLVGRGEVPIRTRAFAAYGLALCGSRLADQDLRKQIIETLRTTLDEDNSSTRDIHVASIIAMGLVPLEAMGGMAEGEKMTEEASAQIDTRMKQIDYLYNFYQGDGHYFVRAHAPAAMVRLLAGTTGEDFDKQKEKIAEEFIRAIKADKDKKEVVQSCVLALGQLGDTDPKGVDKNIRKALIDVTTDITDQQARRFAAISLAQIGGRKGTDGDQADGVDEISKYFLTQIVRGKSQFRPWVGLSIGVMGHELKEGMPPAMIEALREKLRDEKTPLVGAYAVGAGILGQQDFAEILMEKLDRIDDDTARGYLCLGLGMMRATSANVMINDIVKESTYRPELLQQAAIALGLLGDKDVVGDLVDTLGKAKSLATQAALSSALGFIGDKRSIDPLVNMLANDELTNTARGFAAVALGIVADKEPLPWNSKIAVNLNYTATTQTLNDTSGTGILNIL
jgi:HEAT repeat protein